PPKPPGPPRPPPCSPTATAHCGPRSGRWRPASAPWRTTPTASPRPTAPGSAWRPCAASSPNRRSCATCWPPPPPTRPRYGNWPTSPNAPKPPRRTCVRRRARPPRPPPACPAPTDPSGPPCGTAVLQVVDTVGPAVHTRPDPAGLGLGQVLADPVGFHQVRGAELLGRQPHRLELPRRQTPREHEHGGRPPVRAGLRGQPVHTHQPAQPGGEPELLGALAQTRPQRRLAHLDHPARQPPTGPVGGLDQQHTSHVVAQQRTGRAPGARQAPAALHLAVGHAQTPSPRHGRGAGPRTDPNTPAQPEKDTPPGRARPATQPNATGEQAQAPVSRGYGRARGRSAA